MYWMVMLGLVSVFVVVGSLVLWVSWRNTEGYVDDFSLEEKEEDL